MYVDVRWIILVVVVVAAVVVGLLLPTWIPALTLGLGVCGILYLLLRLGDNSGGSASQSDGPSGNTTA